MIKNSHVTWNIFGLPLNHGTRIDHKADTPKKSLFY